MIKKDSKIYIAGHKGMVGSAIVRKLQNKGFTRLLTPSKNELDCIDTKQVIHFFEENKPDYVFLAAAKVGGILANNTYPAEFIYQNLMIQNNIIHSSYVFDVKKLLFLGSSCIYPKQCEQPIKETALLTGPLEPTNSAYAIAKLSGIEMCKAYHKQYGCNFISVMPTNLYGPNDNFDLETSHVLPALLRKCHEAKTQNSTSLEVWGSGTPKREFLHVDDLADACLFLMRNYNDSDIINVGTGVDISIRELANMIKDTIGFDGKLSFDAGKPDGTPRKVMDISKLHNLGWHHTISLREGMSMTYDYLKTLLIQK